MNFVLQKLFNAWFCIPLFCTFSFYHSFITTLNSFQWIYISDIIVFRETFSRSEKPQRRAGIPYLLRRGGKYNISLFVIQKIYLMMTNSPAYNLDFIHKDEILHRYTCLKLFLLALYNICWRIYIFLAKWNSDLKKIKE